jgi:hypothetical protein
MWVQLEQMGAYPEAEILSITSVLSSGVNTQLWKRGCVSNASDSLKSQDVHGTGEMCTVPNNPPENTYRTFLGALSQEEGH